MIEARPGLSDAKRALLEQRLRGRGAVAPPRIPRRDPSRPAVLSPAQAAMWWTDRTRGGGAYVIREAHRLTGSLDADALAAAVGDVIARHDVLRTSYPDVDGRPAPRVHEAVPETWAQHDLHHLPAREREARHQALADDAARAIDVTRGPLVRMTLVRLDAATHVLHLACHHLVCDEWSLGTLWAEVSASYAARRAGREPQLAPVPLQYADLAAWQADRLGTELVPRHEAFWRAVLDGAPPTSRPHPDGPGSDGRDAGLLTDDVPAEVAQALEAVAGAAGTTMFTVLATTFAVLLGRSAGQDDVVIGTPFAGRSRPELQDLVGLCLNSLPLRVTFDAAEPFARLLARTQTRLADALAHADLPFDRIAAAPTRREPGTHPIFQAMLVQSQPAGARLALDGVTVTPGPATSDGAKFDLTLFVLPSADGIALRLEYDRGRYADATAARVAERFRTLLAAIAADPQCPVGRLPLVGPDERRLLTDTWTRTDAPAPVDRTVLDAVRHAASTHAAAPAVIDPRGELSWATLDARAAALAGALAARGVGRGDVVGLCAERSRELVVGLLGILYAGAAYLPLDPTYPPERLAYMVADSGTRVVVATGDAAAAVPPGVEVIALGAASPSAPGGAARVDGPTTDDLAYVIYTSGSTGRPKGVPVRHRQLLHSTAARAIVYADRVERFLLLSSFAFDSSVAGLFWTLTQGGTLCLPAPGEEQDVLALGARIAAWRVSHTLALPSVYALLLAHAPTDDLATLRCAIVAGEACPSSLARQHAARRPGAALWNEYGPTEATVWATVHQVTAADAQRPVPIGRPVPYSRIYVLDGLGAPVPVGAPGEIHIGGAGVVEGYLGQPDLTAARFGADGIAGAGRYYRTGDLGRWRHDGVLEFLGRADRQVKLRGHRVELEEIEAALAAHPAIAESAVTVVEAPGLDPDDLEGLIDAVAALDPDDAARLLREVSQA